MGEWWFLTTFLRPGTGKRDRHTIGYVRTVSKRAYIRLAWVTSAGWLPMELERAEPRPFRCIARTRRALRRAETAVTLGPGGGVARVPRARSGGPNRAARPILTVRELIDYRYRYTKLNMYRSWYRY